MLFYLEETYLGLELESQSYQRILQAETHTIDLLSIQIDKYETKYQIVLIICKTLRCG